MSEFKSYDSYRKFERLVRAKRRYIRDDDTENFLEAVAATAKSRGRRIQKGTRLWRAQRGYGERPVRHPDYAEGIVERRIRKGTRLVRANGFIAYHEKVCYGPHRMKPLVDRAREGRVNPKGIPCLYLASHKEIAMSEVRPPLGSYVSLAGFEIVRDLAVVDCSLDHGNKSNELLKKFFSKMVTAEGVVVNVDPNASPEEVESWVWADINQAFSRPVTADDDVADYAPTQIIAEKFRDMGFEGIAYKSAYATDQEKQYNFALFDLDAAVWIKRSWLFTAESVRYRFKDTRPIDQ